MRWTGGRWNRMGREEDVQERLTVKTNEPQPTDRKEKERKHEREGKEKRETRRKGNQKGERACKQKHRMRQK